MRKSLSIKATLFLIVIVVTLTACTPGQDEAETVINPTRTPQFGETSTGPSQEDGVIVIDPQKFLLEAEELPSSGKYYLPDSTWMSLQTNKKILLDQGVKEGKDFVAETRRVVGWDKNYLRGNMTVRMPDEVYQSIDMYRNAEGAQLALTKYDDHTKADPSGDWRTNEVDFDWKNRVDAVLVQSRQKVRTDGEKQTWYDIKFTFRNFVVSVQGHADFEEDLDQELLSDLAVKILGKLEAAPIVSPEEAEASFASYENW